jgi:hypothetical protein
MTEPIAARLHCPECDARHIDQGEWKTRPHRRHQCERCRFRWIVEPPCYGASDEELGCRRIVGVDRACGADATGMVRLSCEACWPDGKRCTHLGQSEDE